MTGAAPSIHPLAVVDPALSSADITTSPTSSGRGGDHAPTARSASAATMAAAVEATATFATSRVVPPTGVTSGTDGMGDR